MEANNLEVLELDDCPENHPAYAQVSGVFGDAFMSLVPDDFDSEHEFQYYEAEGFLLHNIGMRCS